MRGERSQESVLWRKKPAEGLWKEAASEPNAGSAWISGCSISRGALCSPHPCKPAKSLAGHWVQLWHFLSLPGHSQVVLLNEAGILAAHSQGSTNGSQKFVQNTSTLQACVRSVAVYFSWPWAFCCLGGLKGLSSINPPHLWNGAKDSRIDSKFLL